MSQQPIDQNPDYIFHEEDPLAEPVAETPSDAADLLNEESPESLLAQFANPDTSKVPAVATPAPIATEAAVPVPATPVKEEPAFKEYPVFKQPDPKKQYLRDKTLALPGVLITDEELAQCIELCEEQAKLVKGDAVKIQTVMELIESFYELALNTHGDKFRTFFEQNRGKLAQYAAGKYDLPIRIGFLSTQLDDNVEVISGDIALRLINQVAKTGANPKVPLWHSGIVLTLEPFTEMELLDLNIALTQHQTELGENTRGASFTGDDIHVVGTLVEFILSHVVDCNLKNFDAKKLRKLILANDIPTLLAGALAAIYPGGYPVFHPCVNTMRNKCTYNITSVLKDTGDYRPDTLLDFTKVSRVNSSYLSPSMLEVLSSEPRSRIQDDIMAYQGTLIAKTQSTCRKKTIPLFPEQENNPEAVIVSFKTPSIAEYSEISNQWVMAIKQRVDNAMAMEVPGATAESLEAKKEKYLESYSEVANLVKHTCWVDYLVIRQASGREYTITDRETIQNSLRRFITVDGFKEQFEACAQAFKEESLIAWTAVTNFECPVCKHGQTDPESRIPSLIPINMSGYFFSTMVSRGRTRQNLA